MSTKVPSTPPDKEKPDLWREQLKTLADRNRLTFISVDAEDKQKFWWSTYYLTNPDGSQSHYLGCHPGKTIDIAKEHAAKHSYAVLITMINTWTHTAMVNAAASTSMAVSTYSAPPTAPVNVWQEELKRIAEQRNLTFVCEEWQDQQQTRVATYHLTNPDGSKYCQLGFNSATTPVIARENAASQAVDTLNGLIEMWTTGPAAGSTSAGASGS
jgi:hypothetical protein